MRNNPVEFVYCVCFEVFSVVSSPVDRNHDVARNALRRMVRERENVGQIIVFKELAVRLEHVIIIAEQKAQRPDGAPFLVHAMLDPGAYSVAMTQLERGVLELKGYR